MFVVLLDTSDDQPWLIVLDQSIIIRALRNSVNSSREPFFYETSYTHVHLSHTTYSPGTLTVGEPVRPLLGPIVVYAEVCALSQTLNKYTTSIDLNSSTNRAKKNKQTKKRSYTH